MSPVLFRECGYVGERDTLWGAQGHVPPARSELEGHEGGVGRQDKLNGSAQEALNQIKDKGCAKPYAADSRKVIALGINFSSEKGTIDEFISSN